jgi:hypothetical protein
MDGVAFNEVPKRIRAEEHAAADLDVINTAVKNVISQRFGAYSEQLRGLAMSSRPSSLCSLRVDVSAGFVGLGWVDMESSSSRDPRGPRPTRIRIATRFCGREVATRLRRPRARARNYWALLERKGLSVKRGGLSRLDVTSAASSLLGSFSGGLL